VVTLNRRTGSEANFSDLDDLQSAVKIAHNGNTPVFVTMNGEYSQEQHPLIKKLIVGLKDIKVDGLIIADIGLLLELLKMKIFKEIHMGTGGTTLNSRTAIFYRKLGVSRVTLDRHLTINEIKDISKKSAPLVDLEVFILNELCPNVDGFCTFYHGCGINYIDIKDKARMAIKNKECKFLETYDLLYGGLGCSLSFSKRVFDSIHKKNMNIGKNSQQVWEFSKACGACAIFDFSRMNIKSLKIVGRLAPIESKIRSVGFIRQVLNSLSRERSLSRARFIEKAKKLHGDTYQFDTCSGFSCYYPSVHKK
jgi:putative protease